MQPSPGLHRGKANTIRMVCPPAAGARPRSPVLGVDSALRFVLKLNSSVFEDGLTNALSVTSQVSLLENPVP